MNKHLLFSAFALMCCLTACEKNDDPTPAPQPSSIGGTLVMATTVLNPSGNSGSCYVQTLTDTADVSIDNNRAIPGGFGNPFTVQGKNVYIFPDYMGQSKAALQRFVIDANHQLVKAGEMMLPAGSAASQVIEVNDHTAYVSCQNLGKVLVFDFKQMKQTGEIDLNSLSGAGVRVGPSCMIVRDGKVFIALSQFNAQWMPAKNSIEFAMVDAQTNRLEKHIKNESLGLAFPTRPIDSGTLFMDEKGDIYFACIGSFGLVPGINAGFARIKKGETDIDPTYSIRLDQTNIEGLNIKADNVASLKYAGNGIAYGHVSSNALDPSATANPYSAKTSVAVAVDLYHKTITAIKGIPVSSPHGLAVTKYNDIIIFGCSSDNATGFFYYDTKTKRARGPVIKTAGNPMHIEYIKD
ncbi:hypothetical protein HMPREF9141_2419 [Prevotella multiformis DSM 16608]|uniref:Lipoprotein n=2 Tax=Prevotella multiformis TaxID=282402 RepID=F0FA02_9BACT|nr:hypothetical protein HMPREF9141_2419 [Prevotella multiformis DSM 16608]